MCPQFTILLINKLVAKKRPPTATEPANKRALNCVVLLPLAFGHHTFRPGPPRHRLHAGPRPLGTNDHQLPFCSSSLSAVACWRFLSPRPPNSLRSHPPSRSPPLRERRRAGEWRMDPRTRESAETSGAGLPLAVRELVAGGVAGGVAKSSVAPLERVKILFQARRSTPPPSHFLLR
jgi:hypothetical protein